MAVERNSHHTSSEVPSIEPNSFVNFLTSHESVLDFCETSGDIEAELDGVMGSLSIDYVIDANFPDFIDNQFREKMTSGRPTPGQSHLPKERYIQSVRLLRPKVAIRNSLKRDFINPMLASGEIFAYKVPDPDIDLRDPEFTGSMRDEHKKAFQQAQSDFFESISPLITHQMEVGALALEDTASYLASSPFSAMEDLGIMLHGPEYAPTRKLLAPFLTLFCAQVAHEGGRSIVNQSMKTYKERALAPGSLDLTLISKFVDAVKVQNHGAKIPQILQMAFEMARRTANQVGRDITPEALIEVLASCYEIWPGEIRSEFEKFVNQTCARVNKSVLDGLGKFRQVARPEKIEARSLKKKNSVLRSGSSGNPEDIQPEATQETPTSIELLTSSAPFDDYLEGRVRKLGADAYLLTDLYSALESLRDDPYGVGTKNIHVSYATAGNRKLRLRSYAPKKRPKLHLNSDWHELRLLYAVSGHGEVKVIFIDGPYHHDEYMEKIKLYLGK